MRAGILRLVLILAIKSDKLLRKFYAADNVEVNVHYCLSCAFTTVVDRSVSTADALYLCNFSEGYEQCDFHKYTGWGNWLRINEQKLNQNPQNAGGGPLE